MQNLDFEEIFKVLDRTNLSGAIKLLSVDKNIKLLSKKSDFEFLSKIFKKMSTLNKKLAHRQFLKTSNEYFTQSTHSYLSINIPDFELKKFIEKVLDLSISKNKKHSLKDIEKIILIAKNYEINDKKLVNWIGKISAHTNSTSLLDEVFKLNVLKSPELKERFISIINMTTNIDLLDKLFSHYEYDIYTTYAKYKSENLIWNCLLPLKNWYNDFLPYIDKDKLNWLENKKLGYKNNPCYFEIYTLENLFNNRQFSSDKENLNIKITEDYYQNIIINSLKDYHNIYLPKKEEFNQKYKNLPYNETDNFSNWVKKSPIHSILSIYDNNPSFYEFCKKISFKYNLEIKLINNSKKLNNTVEKKIKI